MTARDWRIPGIGLVALWAVVLAGYKLLPWLLSWDFAISTDPAIPGLIVLAVIGLPFLALVLGVPAALLVLTWRSLHRS